MSLALIPGFMLDNTLWDAFSEQLPAQWPVYDAPLNGGNTIADISHHIVDHLPEQFVLIGFSLGGYIARQIAADYPQRVNALVLIASSAREDSPEMIAAKQRLVSAYTPATFNGLSGGAIGQSLHPARANDSALIKQIKKMGSRLGYDALVTQCGLGREGVPTSAIHCPTLVVAAADDALRSLEESKELAASLPNATMHIIADSGHMLPLEQPQALAEVVTTWLREQGVMAS